MSIQASHLMLLPTLNCPAQCGYCFGPHQGSPVMSPATLEATARWARTLGDGGELRITFHGGEPLLPLGQASTDPPTLEGYDSREEDGAEPLTCRVHLAATCGLGMNISIAPDGTCFRCHALSDAAHALGNACRIKEVIASERFQALRAKTVDTTPQPGLPLALPVRRLLPRLAAGRSHRRAAR